MGQAAPQQPRGNPFAGMGAKPAFKSMGSNDPNRPLTKAEIDSLRTPNTTVLYKASNWPIFKTCTIGRFWTTGQHEYVSLNVIGAPNTGIRVSQLVPGQLNTLKDLQRLYNGRTFKIPNRTRRNQHTEWIVQDVVVHRNEITLKAHPVRAQAQIKHFNSLAMQAYELQSNGKIPC